MPTGVSMKAVVLAFSVVAIMQHAVCSVAAASKFGTNNYVEYVPGDLPIVLTVPHGGSLKPANITDRTAGCGSPCVYAACNTPNTSTCPIRTLSDTNTDDVATEMAAALERLTSRRPHVVFVHLHRSKLDANREADEAAQGDADALQAYNEYFAFVDEAVASVQAGCGFGLVVDVHGQAHSHQNIELGCVVVACHVVQVLVRVRCLSVFGVFHRVWPRCSGTRFRAPRWTSLTRNSTRLACRPCSLSLGAKTSPWPTSFGVPMLWVHRWQRDTVLCPAPPCLVPKDPPTTLGVSPPSVTDVRPTAPAMASMLFSLSSTRTCVSAAT